MSQMNSPEDRHHPRKQKARVNKLHDTFIDKRIMRRIHNYFLHKVLVESPFNSFLRRHSQRTNYTPYFATFILFYYLGSLGHYYNYKRNVVEDRWVEEYGQDVPHFRKFKFSSWIQRMRAEYVHFYRYRMFYFIEEQVIDPLNDNSLSAKAFDVYQFKRLIRAIKYDELRDDSFDFL